MYFLSYAVYCWVHVVVTIAESILGEYPYRFDWTLGLDACRPETYREYARFRVAQTYNSW